MQDTAVCLKHFKSSKKEHALHEASMLSNLNHPSVCFLHGVQCDQKPYYYLVTNLYLINGYSVTIYDLMSPSGINNSDKQEIVQSLHSKLDTDSWCCNTAEALNYIHSKHSSPRFKGK